MFEVNPLPKRIRISALSVIFVIAAVFPAGCTGSAASRTASNSRSAPMPSWVNNPDSDFPGQRYLAQVGYGADRLQAEQNALASLAAVFGQSIQSETTSFVSYAQALRNGSIEFTENKAMESEVIASVDMDSLLGVEISEVWFDGVNMHYAVAVMDKPRAVSIYTDLYSANERLIAGLAAIVPAERNTIYGYSRYLLAAAVADVNRVYANMLAILGGAAAFSGQAGSGDEYRFQAAEIAKTIPIAVAINGDTSNRRLGNAFARALNGLGFLSGGNDSRYVLEGEFIITSTQTDAQGNVYLRYSLTAGLRDNTDSIVILPFNAAGREGHLNESSAQDLVMRVLENRITGEFAKTLQDYLSASLPGIR